MSASRFDSVIQAVADDTLDLPAVVASFAPYLHIAHQIPGRIRFRIELAALDDPAIRRLGSNALSDALAGIRGVRDIKLNKLARSCVVEYDRAQIPDTAWADLLAGRDTPAAQSLSGILQDRYAEVRHG